MQVDTLTHTHTRPHPHLQAHSHALTHVHIHTARIHNPTYTLMRACSQTLTHALTFVLTMLTHSHEAHTTCTHTPPHTTPCNSDGAVNQEILTEG